MLIFKSLKVHCGVFKLRLPAGSTDDVNVDPTGDKGLWDRGILNGASQKFDTLCSFYLGETPTTLQKSTLIPGGGESIVYTTLSGSIGILVPFNSNEVCSDLIYI